LINQILDVYLHEQFVGKLRQGNAGFLQFQYDEAYLVASSPVAVSLSLPLQLALHEGQNVRAFFSGLLPDDIARHKLARYLGVSEKNSFALLEAIGGECAGALALYPTGQTPPLPKADDTEKLDDKALREILNLLKQRPLMAGNDNVRLSLAGTQDKLAVSVVDDVIALVKGSTPTTHILKPMIGDIKDSVQNELFCLRLANFLKIETPHADIRWVGETPYYLIERYDRQLTPKGDLIRLHQEDFCQALGILPEFKYEREGGPTIAQSLTLLQNYSGRPAADRLAFLQRVIFNYLIGNSDAHGKNFSFLYMSKEPILAPAYDLLCTTVYPQLSNKMAMKIGGQYDPMSVLLRYWHCLVPDTAAAKKALNKELIKMAKECLDQVKILKKEFQQQGVVSSIFEEIIAVIKIRASMILDT
jgi:serine/threonine-protein kinase HipA